MLELKELQSHLQYVFLGERNTFLVIIAAYLVEPHVEALVSILKRHKSSIWWTIVDIIDILPHIYTYKIQLVKYYTQTIKYQRRLNPHIQEVVKKDIIKCLDVGVYT